MENVMLNTRSFEKIVFREGDGGFIMYSEIDAGGFCVWIIRGNVHGTQFWKVKCNL